MSAVTPVSGGKYESWNNNVKELSIALSNSPLTGDTYDTNMDATDGKGSEFREIFEVRYSQKSGQNVDSTTPTWDSSTGIVTLGTVSPLAAALGSYLHIKGK